MTRRKMLIALALGAALLPGCAGDVNQAPDRRFKLQGKVVAVKTNMGAHHLRIEHGEIPGFMEAMTMDYRVRPEENITTFQPGDEISADIVVSGIRTHYIENVTVTKKAEAAMVSEATPAGEAPPVGK
jgi:protein SCO1/2